ncbi:SH3 domain protein [Elysia marginata]|uniref:SH3 domain protein n=1 Tax=Elysia marginata TaxID=1093978 RepID=A0AAV4IHY2_9GAST|nr:SH3 domain protein [Elysia marginata]
MGRIEATLAGFMREMKEMMNEVKEIGRIVKSIEEKVEKHEGILSSLSEKVENSKTLNGVQRKVNSSSEEVKEVSEKIKYMEERLNKAEERVVDQEARLRRNNLIFHGVPESDREECKSVVRNILKEKCRIERVDNVERAHRIGRRPRGATGGSHRKPRALIVRFNNYNERERERERERVRETRRNLPSTISVTEDLPYEVRQARRQLIPEMLEAKRTGKAAWLAYHARLIINGEEVKSVTPRPQPQMTA